jgi:HAD superfamily hydrolase (TIGR01509 family)
MGDAVAQTLRVGGVIFDMDGLLVDTERLAMRGLANAAVDMGVDAPESFHYAMIGIPADRCRDMVQERFGPGFPAEAYLAAASRHMDRLVEAGQLRLKPGVLDLLSHLDQLGLPKAVATSSSRPKADRHLRDVGILGRFDVVVTRDDVARGKPHPDLFLRASKGLGLPPGRCLVLEDSYNGVRAASAAGSPVIMVPDLLPATEEMRMRCVMIAADLDAVRKLALV